MPKFKDIKNGELFTCWGDANLGFYDFPKLCLMIKEDDTHALEIESDGRTGVRFMLGENEEYSLFEDDDPDLELTYFNYILRKDFND